MIKIYRTSFVVLLIVLIACTASAQKDSNNTGLTFTYLEGADSPTNRSYSILAYNFADGPISYNTAGALFGYQGVLPAGFWAEAFGFENKTSPASTFQMDSDPLNQANFA